MTIEEALQAVVNEATGGDAAYAKTYANAGLTIGGSKNTVVLQVGNAIGIAHEKTGKTMVGEELRVQILYVLSNLGNWRGERAREVKSVLKKVIK